MKTNPRSPVECPAARALDCVGEWWSILILREAFQGSTRFDEFKASLGIAPNMLSRRLSHLTAAGVFERRLYCENPPRYEYLLTEMGRDFLPVLVALFAWGNRHLAPEGKAVLLVDRNTARPIEPVMVDAQNLAPITSENLALTAGPGASAAMRDRLAAIRGMRLNSFSPNR